MKGSYHFCEWMFAYLCILLKRKLLALFLSLFIFILILRWRFMCINIQPRLHVQNICSEYDTGQSVGSLCKALCDVEDVTAIACHTLYLKKNIHFTGNWKNNSLVFKVVNEIPDQARGFVSEEEFMYAIRENIKNKFHISIDADDAKRMSYLQTNHKSLNRQAELQNAWILLHNNEYLALSLYEKYDIFPKLFGSCGPVYAVQKLNSISGYWHLMTIYDTQDEWERRIRISLLILDFLLLLEERLPEPLHLCNVQMNNFGVTSDYKKVKYVELDSVHPVSVVNKLTGNGSTCKKHSDCDLIDCRSFCNLMTYTCQHGVVNNNLQIVCERIFLGWVMSGKLMVPGLLLGPRTPRELTELLEMCANPASESGTPRAPATKDIRKRLYNLLTHLLAL